MRAKVLLGAGIILVPLIIFCATRIAREARPHVTSSIEAPLSPTVIPPSGPTDLAIARAERSIQQNPALPDGYNQLGIAFIQKTRETGDFAFIRRAEAAAKHSVEIAPENYGALQLQAKLAAANHRFAEALDIAHRAITQRPRDLEMYGIITDANVEMGNYPDAMAAAETMVRIRPYAPSFARMSYLGSLHGDTAGAIEAMRMAAQAAADPESTAWYAVHLGDELMNSGQRAEAEREYDRALHDFPNYHFALAGKARARIGAGDLNAAMEYYQRAQERVPLPDVAIALGNLYARLGRESDAQKQYDLAEFIEKSGTAGQGTYSRQIALSWADRGIKLDEALAITERERAARSDIYTCDALAWCLYKKGQLEEAKAAMEEALRLGTRDAQLHYHAGMIHQALGARARAIEHLRLALEINPTFDVVQAEVAKQTLQSLSA